MTKYYVTGLLALFVSCAAPVAFASGEGGGRGQRLKEMDADGSGTISRSEFLAMTGKRFDKMDTDGDGELSKEEMAAMRGKFKQGGGATRGGGGERFP